MLTIGNKTFAGATIAWQNLDRAREAVDSVHRFYPTMPVLTWVNPPVLAGQDAANCYVHGTNIGHGGAINEIMQRATTDYMFFFDADTTMRRGDMIEDALEWAWYADVYGIGLLHSHPIKGGRIPYLHPAVCLLNVAKYRLYAPAIDHGAPLIAAMYDLWFHAASHACVGFPMDMYVYHEWRGSRDKSRAAHYSYRDWDHETWLDPDVFMANAGRRRAAPANVKDEVSE